MADYSWKPAKRKYGVVIWSFAGGIVRGSVPLQIGETVHIWEEYSCGTGPTRSAKWYRGYSISKRAKKGIFPATHVHLKECKVDHEGPFETITPTEDPIVKELAFTLREWSVIWKKLYVDGHPLFQTIEKVMLELLDFQRQLLSNTLTQDQAREVKREIVSRIDWGNSKLGMDLVPRIEGEQVDVDLLSTVELFRIHQEGVENSQGTWPPTSTGRRSRSLTQPRSVQFTHLLVNFKSFACSVGDESETFLSLYDPATGKFICEKFLFRFNKNGMPVNMDKLHNYCALFTELGENDVGKDLYLVAQIFRIGRMLPENSGKKIPTLKYRRPWGVSVLSLKDFFNINPEEELEFHLRVQSCFENESNFPQLHENLIKKQNQLVGKGITTDKQNIAPTLSLKILHGDLSSVRAENPILFNKGVTLVPKIGFSDYINPGEVRNDLYLMLITAEFERGNKKAAKNVEVRVSVFDKDGKQIPECITGGCGEPLMENYFSSVFYHQNNPKWNETIRLSIPIEKFIGAHIRLEFCHCSTRDKSEKKKMYGFSFIKVTENDITQEDGNHVLCVYKCTEINKVKNYIHLPSFQDDFNDPKIIPCLPTSIPFQHSNKEYCTISTFLCSTKFTQKSDLLGVLQWKSNPKKIELSLRNLIRLRGQEVVKHLQDIMDALFNMFSANNGERVQFATEVFHALIHIFNLLQDSMFEKFSCVLEAYLEETFSSPVVHRDLMLCLQEKVEMAVSCADFEDDFTIEKVFQVLEHVFRFTVRSSLLFEDAFGRKCGDFKDRLVRLFDSLGRILSSTESSLRKAQQTLLTELHKTFVPLLHVISRRELAELVHCLLNKMPKDINRLLLNAKMKLAREIVASDLFSDSESRCLLLSLCMSLIKRCLIQKLVLKLSAETLGDILDKFFKMEKDENVQDEIQHVVMAMFDIIIQTLLVIDEDQLEEAGGMLICCLLELLRLMNDSHYSTLMKGYPKGQPLKDFLIRILLVFRDLIKRQVYSPDWAVMRMVTNHVILTAIQYVAHALMENFLHGENFDAQLWSNYFDLAVGFVTQPSLQLEQFSEAKRQKMKDKYQDMRVLIGLQIHTLWNGLGNHKHYFIPCMIGPFLEVAMVPETDLRKAILPIFFDMMNCEQKSTGGFVRVESELIDKLDSLITGNSGDVEFKQLFNSLLLDKVQTEPALEKDGRRFVISVTNLLERLLDYRQVIDGDENRDKRMHCTFNILNFYKDNREEMYIRYINKLFHLHHDADNFVEAGLTLQLYAKLLDWKNDHLSAYLGYPSQPEWQRKEMLYLKIIQCFDKGKAWEYGIPLCKDLAEVYEKKLFQYKKLSEILQREAAFFNNILEGSALRQNPSYYRVVYHGTSFPPFLRNKAFVYRGDECLKLDTIRQHLMTEFPSATILSTNSQDESLKECEAQNIQIVSVKPVPEEKPEFHDQDVPSEIKNFYSVNEVNVFQFDRPYYVGRKDGINEFRNLWLERTLLKTSYKLPGILRWYEVVQTQVVHLSPVCAAIENIKTMNMQLCHLVERCKSNTDVHFKQMEMRLQGVVTGAVNGGIPKYQEAFFAKEFLMKHPEESNHLTELTSVLWEQIDLISRGLHLHGEMSTDDMKPLHRNLVQIFTKLKQGLSDSGSPRSGRLCVSVVGTPPRPSTPGGGSYHSSGSNRSSIISQEEENTYMDPPELTNRLQQSHGTGSDPALNHSQATGKGLSTSVSSSNLDSRGTRPQMKRFVSNPDTSLIDSSIPPPLPVRKNSDTNLLMTRPPPPPPRQSVQDPRILSLYPSPPSVPTSSLTPDDRSTSQNRPTVKHRTSLLSLNGSIGGEQGLSPLQETGMVEHPHRVQPNEEMTTPKIPPRTPVIPPRPAIFRPPANTISVIKDAQQSVKEGVKSSPPPIPSRAGKRLSNSLPENTKM